MVLFSQRSCGPEQGLGRRVRLSRHCPLTSTHWPRPVHSVHSLDPLMPCHSLRPQAGNLGAFLPLWRRRMPPSGWTHRLSWSPPPATPSEVRVCGSSCPGDLKTLSRAKDCRMGPREADLISGASQGPLSWPLHPRPPFSPCHGENCGPAAPDRKALSALT